MNKIQTLNKISTKGLELFPRDNYEIASEFQAPDGILVRSAKMHDMELAPSVKAIARAGAGVNNIPIDMCTGKGIVVFNTPGANANGVKELVLAGMFLASRNIIPAVEWVKGIAGNGDQVPQMVEKGKSQFVGPELAGKKLGIIGLGAIGVMVANAAEALGMQVTGYDPFISVEAAWGLSQTVKRAVGLDSLVADSDYISIHVPLNDKTRGMIDAGKFAMMKDGVRLLNLARGGLVNNQDLKDAIAKGKIAAYVTDFPDDELLSMDRVIPLPHLGASTPESEENCAVMAVNQMRAFLEDGNLRNSVNFPDCEMPRTGSKRLVVANRNVPNMVGQITGTLAEQSINIADMINKHRNELAYNIIDVDGEIGDEIADKIRQIDGVLMARVIN